MAYWDGTADDQAAELERNAAAAADDLQREFPGWHICHKGINWWAVKDCPDHGSQQCFHTVVQAGDAAGLRDAIRAAMTG